VNLRDWPGGPTYGDWWPDHYFTMLLVAAVLFVGFHRGWIAAVIAGVAVIVVRYLSYFAYRRSKAHAERRR
jgi:hypothetical protein